jgi:hypothetical protein
MMTLRAPAQRIAPRASKTAPFPAPRRGWIQNENLAKHKPEGAALMDNWFPLATGIRVRRGSNLRATIGTGTPVGAFMVYQVGNGRIFAANDTAIYDITNVGNPSVSPVPAISGLTSGDWSSAMFTNAGGRFLVAVNGSDERRVYDGTAWTAGPAITGGPGANGNKFSHVWAYKGRLFYIEKDTLNVWYHGVDQIGGAVTKFPLNGIARHGGALYYGGTWSYEPSGGDLAESILFVTTEGEALVYDGSDPGTATDWSLKGVYRIGRPLGKRAAFKSGGDLAIATDIGLIPMSSALSRDTAALYQAALSYPIEEAWNTEAISRRAQFSWCAEMWPTQQMAIIGMPSYGALQDQCFVVNIRTGAWTRYTGWNVQCLGLLNDRMFFGTRTGLILEAELGSSDNGKPYTAAMIPLHEDFGSASIKQANMARYVTLTSQTVQAQLNAVADYSVKLPPQPAAALATTAASLWDVALWDAGYWSDGDTVKKSESKWQSVSAVGEALAPVIQITIGGGEIPDIELVRIDLNYETGFVV